jgi:inorganic pyrophosphatase
MKSLENLAPVAKGRLRVIVETPRGSRGKLTFDPELGTFELTHVLGEGLHFPCDFGFVPSTRGGDGDPLDVMVLGEARVAPGTLLSTRLIGAIQAEQRKGGKGKAERNDRLIAVECHAPAWNRVKELSDLPGQWISQLEFFFVSYNKLKGKQFSPLKRLGSAAAWKLVRASLAGKD